MYNTKAKPLALLSLLVLAAALTRQGCGATPTDATVSSATFKTASNSCGADAGGTDKKKCSVVADVTGVTAATKVWAMACLDSSTAPSDDDAFTSSLPSGCLPPAEITVSASNSALDVGTVIMDDGMTKAYDIYVTTFKDVANSEIGAVVKIDECACPEAAPKCPTEKTCSDGESISCNAVVSKGFYTKDDFSCCQSCTAPQATCSAYIEAIEKGCWKNCIEGLSKSTIEAAIATYKSSGGDAVCTDAQKSKLLDKFNELKSDSGPHAALTATIGAAVLMVVTMLL
eukprot:g4685.t1